MFEIQTETDEPLLCAADSACNVCLGFLFSVCAATETFQPGESDRSVSTQTEASPGVRVLRSHRPQRAGPPSQRVGVSPHKTSMK